MPVIPVKSPVPDVAMSVSVAEAGKRLPDGVNTVVIGPAAVPFSVPTIVVKANSPGPKGIGAGGKTREMQPCIWSVTVPTALLPGYVASKIMSRKLHSSGPTPIREAVPVSDDRDPDSQAHDVHEQHPG